MCSTVHFLAFIHRFQALENHRTRTDYLILILGSLQQLNVLSPELESFSHVVIIGAGSGASKVLHVEHSEIQDTLQNYTYYTLYKKQLNFVLN
jgi:hypothetical protein